MLSYRKNEYIIEILGMSKIIDWIKEHVSPYATIRDDREDYPIVKNDDESNVEDDIKDELKKTEVGIKFTWKW